MTALGSCDAPGAAEEIAGPTEPSRIVEKSYEGRSRAAHPFSNTPWYPSLESPTDYSSLALCIPLEIGSSQAGLDAPLSAASTVVNNAIQDSAYGEYYDHTNEALISLVAETSHLKMSSQEHLDSKHESGQNPVDTLREIAADAIDHFPKTSATISESELLISPPSCVADLVSTGEPHLPTALKDKLLGIDADIAQKDVGLDDAAEHTSIPGDTRSKSFVGSRAGKSTNRPDTSVVTDAANHENTAVDYQSKILADIGPVGSTATHHKVTHFMPAGKPIHSSQRRSVTRKRTASETAVTQGIQVEVQELEPRYPKRVRTISQRKRSQLEHAR